MTESSPDAADAPATRIATALARLRGPRPAWGPGRPGGFGGRGFGPPPGFAPSHVPHPHRDGGPPWRGGDHGPMGRMAARVRLLDALAQSPDPLSVSEIAERIGVDQPRASRLVQAGVAAGHLKREVDPTDARRTNVVLTDSGRAIADQARTARLSAVDTALAGFTAEESEQLARLLSKLADAWPQDPSR